MRAVTISREYGSGGGEIATRLAQALDWRLVDHEVVTQIAQRLGVEVEDAAAHDEQAESWVVQFLSTMQTVGPMVALPSNLSFPPDDAAYTRALRDVVHGAVLAGQTVIVGRGSQIILAKRRDTLHVRVVAPLDMRVSYVAQREDLTPAAAQQRIQQKDLQRRRYLWTTYRHAPDEAGLYDITLNTAVLDLDSCVNLIKLALESKATRLAVPVEALGPKAHLPPYPTAPADFPPPNDTAATANTSTPNVAAGESGV
jgi:cytidylate kinase